MIPVVVLRLIHRAEGLGCELVYIISLNSGDNGAILVLTVKILSTDDSSTKWWNIIHADGHQNDWNRWVAGLYVFLARDKLVGFL